MPESGLVGCVSGGEGLKTAGLGSQVAEKMKKTIKSKEKREVPLSFLLKGLSAKRHKFETIIYPKTLN
jgi:hypothetical protein